MWQLPLEMGMYLPVSHSPHHSLSHDSWYLLFMSSTGPCRLVRLDLWISILHPSFINPQSTHPSTFIIKQMADNGDCSDHFSPTRINPEGWLFSTTDSARTGPTQPHFLGSRSSACDDNRRTPSTLGASRYLHPSPSLCCFCSLPD